MIIEARLSDNEIERVALRVVELLDQAHGASGRWLDVAGAAEHLRLSEEAIRGLIKRRRLPVHKTENGRLRFSMTELDQWVRSGLAKSATRTYDDHS
jgi:excisionase family DNA binding protein